MRSKRRPTITYRLHAQRALMVPSIMLRRGYLEKVHLAQIQSEKDAILSHIGRLQPGVRDEYLRHKQRSRLKFNAWFAFHKSKGTNVTDEDMLQAKFQIGRFEKNAHDLDRLQSGKHVEYLQTRDDTLTERIPKKAVGL